MSAPTTQYFHDQALGLLYHDHVISILPQAIVYGTFILALYLKRLNRLWVCRYLRNSDIDATLVALVRRVPAVIMYILRR